MRILLLSNYGSHEVEHSALALDIRGYEALTYFELHQPEYPPNKGMVASEKDAHRQLALELIGMSAVLVVHPDCDPALVSEMAGLCRAIKAPMLKLSDLPFAPPKTDEERDALTSCGIAEPFASVTENLAERIVLMHEPHSIPALAVVPRDPPTIGGLYGRELLGTPGTDFAVPPPSQMDILLAEDESAFSSDRITRNLRMVITMKWKRALRWTDRLRALMRGRQPVPRPYRLHNTPLATTS